jgi:hypothetical protein
MAGAAAGHIQAAEAQLESFCGLLVAAGPDHLDRSEGCLAAAVEELKLALEFSKPALLDRSVMVGIERLLGRMRMGNRLLENMRCYHDGWQHLLSVMSGGYTAEGAPVPRCHARQISVTG